MGAYILGGDTMYYYKQYLESTGTPFDDDYMQYILIDHQYELKQQYVVDRLGINFALKVGGDNNIPVFLEDIRNDIYNYIWKNINQSEKARVIEYMIAKDIQNNNYQYSPREGIRRAMIEQARYALTFGKDMENKRDGKEVLSPNAIMYLENAGLLAREEFMFQIKNSDYRNGY